MKYKSIGLIVRYDYKMNRCVPWFRVETRIGMTTVMATSKIYKKDIFLALLFYFECLIFSRTLKAANLSLLKVFNPTNELSGL
jgi:hypothetical protein